MSNENQKEITFDRLSKFLISVGFSRSAKVNQTMAYHHDETGTIVTLTIPVEGQGVRSADLLSILVRLENQGIVEELALSQLRNGRIPFAA